MLIRAGDYYVPETDGFFKGILEAGEFEPEIKTKALESTSKRRTFVDVGGHIGTWSKPFASKFKQVVAFEPCHQNQWAFTRNCLDLNVKLYPLGCGDVWQVGYLTFVEGNTGGTHISDRGQPFVITPLDDMDLVDVDLIKIDTEGFEVAVLRGAQKTIKAYKPTVVLENCGWHERHGLDANEIPDLLHGYRQVYRDLATGEEIWICDEGEVVTACESL